MFSAGIDGCRCRRSPDAATEILFNDSAGISGASTVLHSSLGHRPEFPSPPPLSLSPTVRLESHLGNSLNPRPLRINGTHFSVRASLVFACFAAETWKM